MESILRIRTVRFLLCYQLVVVVFGFKHGRHNNRPKILAKLFFCHTEEHPVEASMRITIPKEARNCLRTLRHVLSLPSIRVASRQFQHSLALADLNPLFITSGIAICSTVIALAVWNKQKTN